MRPMRSVIVMPSGPPTLIVAEIPASRAGSKAADGVVDVDRVDAQPRVAVDHDLLIGVDLVDQASG